MQGERRSRKGGGVGQLWGAEIGGFDLQIWWGSRMPGGTRFGREYGRRVVDDELHEVFTHLPAILIDGPKGVGKTETALQRCRSVRRLDTESDRAIVGADPMVIAEDRPPVLLDEWHRDSVWAMVDNTFARTQACSPR